MRTCLALFCTLALFASPLFLVCVEADRNVQYPDAVYPWFDPWLPLVMILCSSVFTLAVPWIVSLLADEDPTTRL